MKKWLLLLVSLGLFACDKDRDSFSMIPSELPGTYWLESEYHIFKYENGKYVSYDLFDGDWDGGRGRSVLFFSSETSVVEFVSSSFVAEDRPQFYYKNCVFNYDADWKRLYTDMNTLGTDVPVVVELFTPGKIVLSFVGGEMELSKEKHVFIPYTPTEEWKRQAAQYPDYDDIDWSEVR